MRSNRSRDTGPELALRKQVHALGLRYRVAAIPIPGIRHRADLVFKKARVAVFLDGCFWHGCPEHCRRPVTNSEYWKPKIDGNIRRDREIDTELAKAGWIALRIWEHEDLALAATDVARIVRSRQAGRLPQEIEQGCSPPHSGNHP